MPARFVGVIYDSLTCQIRRVITVDNDSHLAHHRLGRFERMVRVFDDGYLDHAALQAAVVTATGRLPHATFDQ